MPTSAVQAYRTVDATTADPVTLTTMLYDGAIKAVKKARLLHEQQDRQRFLGECERAYLIVGELLSTLDLQYGELPRSMAAIYSYCLNAITRATLGEMAQLDEVEKHITRIALAWRTATDALKADQARQLRSSEAVA
ncbi:MAG: flagellar export chaperone FliS [Dehalococcoidia bacterium]